MVIYEETTARRKSQEGIVVPEEDQEKGWIRCFLFTQQELRIIL
jgi:hypothetical protein